MSTTRWRHKIYWDAPYVKICEYCAFMYLAYVKLLGQGGPTGSPASAEAAAMRDLERKERSTRAAALTTHGVICPCCRQISSMAIAHHFPDGFKRGIRSGIDKVAVFTIVFSVASGMLGGAPAMFWIVLRIPPFTEGLNGPPAWPPFDSDHAPACLTMFMVLGILSILLVVAIAGAVYACVLAPVMYLRLITMGEDRAHDAVVRTYVRWGDSLRFLGDPYGMLTLIWGRSQKRKRGETWVQSVTFDVAVADPAPYCPIPSEAELGTLPRWALAVLASRCARRVYVLVEIGLGDGDVGSAAMNAITFAERSAANGAVEGNGAGDGGLAKMLAEMGEISEELTRPKKSIYTEGLSKLGRNVLVYALASAGEAARGATAGDKKSCASAARKAAESAVRAAWLSGMSSDGDLVREDFNSLRDLVRSENWTDDTPVNAERLGHLRHPLQRGKGVRNRLSAFLSAGQ